MKAKFLILFLFVSSIVFSQKREKVYFQSEFFDGYYSEIKEQPLVVNYRVKNCNYGYSRRGLKFFKNDSIHTADDNDYYKNVWDKGHMVPAASNNCTKKSIRQTFSYLNCALQYDELNRGVWRYLEEWERELAMVYDVDVKIVVEFKTNQVLKTGATIPSGFFKYIYVIGEDITYSFYFPNTKPASLDFNYYKID
jgi:DNA/RNA endonuclease G (NUC1)